MISNAVIWQIHSSIQGKSLFLAIPHNMPFSHALPLDNKVKQLQYRVKSLNGFKLKSISVKMSRHDKFIICGNCLVNLRFGLGENDSQIFPFQHNTRQSLFRDLQKRQSFTRFCGVVLTVEVFQFWKTKKCRFCLVCYTSGLLMSLRVVEKLSVGRC